MFPTVTITVNTLRTFPMGNPNRGDDNQVKRAVFGKSERTYRSPQNRKALQRRLRGPQGFDAVIQEILDTYGVRDVDQSIRTRKIDTIIKNALSEVDSPDQERMKALRKAVSAALTQSSKDGNDPILILGAPEIAAIQEVVRDLYENSKVADYSKSVDARLAEVWKQLCLDRVIVSCGLDGALFGTMATNKKRPEARSAVAYGFEFSVHPATRFHDAFIALDDLDPVGSAHMDVHSRASGTHYGDIMIDVRQLVENITSDVEIRKGKKGWRAASQEDFEIAGLIAAQLVRVNEEANITAVHSNSAGAVRSDLIYIEVCEAAPHNYANAFLKPVNGQDIVHEAAHRLVTFASSFQDKYNHVSKSTWLAPHPAAEEVFTGLASSQQSASLDDLCEWVRQSVVQLRQG